jgi:hypothetical protein
MTSTVVGFRRRLLRLQHRRAQSVYISVCRQRRHEAVLEMSDSSSDGSDTVVVAAGADRSHLVPHINITDHRRSCLGGYQFGVNKRDSSRARSSDWRDNTRKPSIGSDSSRCSRGSPIAFEFCVWSRRNQDQQWPRPARAPVVA